MADWQNLYQAYNDDPTRSGPTGIPDPQNPGFDTGGFPLDNNPGIRTEYPTDPSDPNTLPVPAPTAPVATPDPGRVAHTPVPTTQGPGPAPGPTPPPAPPPTGGDPLGGVLAPFSEAGPQFPKVDPFTPLQFKAPSIQDAFDDKAWQWQRDQTLDSLNRAAAAKGTLNDSGTLRGFLDLGNNIANQRLGDVWSRANTEYQNNEGALERAYGANRQTQSIDPFTAAYNAWKQRGDWYLGNQGNATNALLGFGQLFNA
jgi:hypothetical protein